MDEKRKENVGSLLISEDVIATICVVAAKDVSGVYDVKINPKKFGKLLGKDKSISSVAVTHSDDGSIIITIDVVLNEGAKIKETAAEVQNNIKSAVQSMTSCPVSKVNVNIADIHLHSEDGEKH